MTAGGLSATTATPQAVCGTKARVTVRPTRPRDGTLFVVNVRDAPADAAMSGTVTGEALHFRRDSAGVAHAFAPAPIRSAKVTLFVVCSRGARSDTVRTVVALASGTYAVDRLRVAPNFSAPPDSALAARQQREAELTRALTAVTHDTPRLWTAPFIAPRDSRITSPFGNARKFNRVITSRHMGTDYAGAVGAPIHAANRGVVRLVDNLYFSGNTVYVDHGAGLLTAYLHMSATRVAVGDTVERGALLGFVGATGRVTGPHLHFIVRYGRVSVDPESLLRATSVATSNASPRRATAPPKVPATKGAMRATPLLLPQFRSSPRFRARRILQSHARDGRRGDGLCLVAPRSAHVAGHRCQLFVLKRRAPGGHGAGKHLTFHFNLADHSVQDDANQTVLAAGHPVTAGQRWKLIRQPSSGRLMTRCACRAVDLGTVHR